MRPQSSCVPRAWWLWDLTDMFIAAGVATSWFFFVSISESISDKAEMLLESNIKDMINRDFMFRDLVVFASPKLFMNFRDGSKQRMEFLVLDWSDIWSCSWSLILGNGTVMNHTMRQFQSCWWTKIRLQDSSSSIESFSTLSLRELNLE